MLRISELEGTDQGVVLKVEGKISGHWIEEMLQSCRLALYRATSVSLDLTDVAFADRSGVRALAGLRKQGVALVNCSAFLTEQLKAAQEE